MLHVTPLLLSCCYRQEAEEDAGEVRRHPLSCTPQHFQKANSIVRGRHNCRSRVADLWNRSHGSN